MNSHPAVLVLQVQQLTVTLWRCLVLGDVDTCMQEGIEEIVQTKH